MLRFQQARFCNAIFNAPFLCAAAAFFTIAFGGCTAVNRPHDVATSIPGAGITIYAAGDIADCKWSGPAMSGAAGTAALINTRLATDKDAAVLTLGDHTYPNGQPAEFTDCYAPTWGQFKSRTFPAPGNHEYYTPNAPGYYDYFGAAAGPDRRGYYSFDLGTWHIISLNSYLQPQQHAAQLNWLKADLERHKTHCTLAFWHHPVYSSGGHGNTPRMGDIWKALYEANVDVVLAAHEHNYERFAPQGPTGDQDPVRGIRQFVVGTGGAQLTPLWFSKPNSEIADNSVHGVLKMVLKETGYEWEFLPVEAGRFTDRGATLCH